MLASGQRRRLRQGQVHRERDQDHPEPLPHRTLPRTFQAFYTAEGAQPLRGEFPQLVSSSRVVALLPPVLLPLVASLHTQMGACSGISFIDSPPLAVCHHARSKPHTVCAAAATRGKAVCRLVRRLQAAAGGQRARGAARLQSHPRQRR
jgi:hypothetical protein